MDLDLPLSDRSPEPRPADPAAGGCHAGAAEMERAARAAGKSATLDQYAADYPRGPHDQPQSMCPAFGSLRVGLRMKRTATILSGSACCVYGLTFTSHFYGAKRTVGYVPFNSERSSPASCSRISATRSTPQPIRRFMTRSSSPIFAFPRRRGVPLRLLPKEINGVRIIGIDVPGFGVPTHAEAKDVLAGAMLNYARLEAEQARSLHPPVAAPASRRSRLSARCSPADPIGIARLLEPLGLAAGPVTPTREWRELYAALDCSVVAGIHPFYTSVFREVEAAGRPIIGSAPVGVDGTADWLDRIGKAANIASDRIDAAKAAALPAIRGALAGKPVKGRITLSGYEGSELLVARLLIESGADVRYVGTACARTPHSAADRDWLEAHGVHVQFRASLEQDLAAMAEFRPDLAIGTTPVVQRRRKRPFRPSTSPT